MILIDFSQLAIANLHQQIRIPLKERGYSPNNKNNSISGEVNPDMLRHMILNSIRKINREFKQNYGPLVICADNSNYWRKSAFKYYKANRKKDRDDSGIDWNLVFQTLNILKHELQDVFPYKMMDVSLSEADDVIAILSKHFKIRESILIVSSDKDFIQLLDDNVSIYRPIQEEFILLENNRDKVETSFKIVSYTKEQIEKFKKEHILRGDKGDGVPNFKSVDESLATGIRQTPLFDAKIDIWVTQQPEEFCENEIVLAQYNRNKKLVDLSEIPTNIETSILEEFKKSIIGKKSNIFKYLIKNKMKDLLDLIQDF